MATGQTGRNCAQMPCTTATGTLTSEQKQPLKSIPVAFIHSAEMQTAGVQKVRPEDVAWAEAFTQVVRYCAENDEQITITDLCEYYLNGDMPYTEKYVKMKLESHFGEDIILIGVKGKWNVVTSWSTAKEKDEGKMKQIAAKLLLVNNNIETMKEYVSGAKVADLAANLDYIPPSLLVFCCCHCSGRKNFKSK